MKTDSIFYTIFKTDPGILFELLGQPSTLATGYEFRSVEIKQLAFRIDGLFLPRLDAPDQTVIFLENQFQPDPEFYHRFFGEIITYLKQYPSTADWQAVVIFPERKIEPDDAHLYRALLNSDQVYRLYLEDLADVTTDSIGIGLMQLIIADSVEAASKARSLLSRAKAQGRTDPQMPAIMELIETIVIYKFPQLERAEIERMLGLSDLKETKVYQEAVQEGQQKGRLEESQSLVLRQLTRRLGEIPPELRSQIEGLSLEQTEALGEALLDFTEQGDLVEWLEGNR
ncbi:hypothetical protein C1752_08984 [Acaryochloris thomasi RCC1774]|uniref:DUF4351 domain-containing protein n=1 Tax=Acaryochloris thomasi RCC1774 TaxID=1764569 RepID=A0A2W1JIE1_9CYAN|nr:Rpn family recombination-promoting nuclease/putative transposase [Acaryochloris thomasi]PZD70842.1 hypothetical protein C1752_08984 [Acaryochloris thomasi RCC1774]